MVGNYEVILIFDNCDDNSQDYLIRYFNTLSFSEIGIKRVLMIEQKSPVFETTCDNIGFRLSKGKYIIEIQADMKIITFGFNHILTKPFRIWDDIFAVSGRCTHGIMANNGMIYYTGGVGKLGELVESPVNIDFKFMNKIFILDTCNRGPIAFINERIKEIGYLDEQNFVLGDDDHDLMMRARYKKGWLCCHYPIEFYSPISLGSTRKEMNKENKEYLQNRKSRSNGGFLGQMSIHNPSQLEVRDLGNKIINYR
jgi:hypothetical protein